MVPWAAPPSTDQVTAVFGVPVTLALNCFVKPICTVALAGVTVTMTGGGTSVIVASAGPGAWATDVARRVTVAGLGNAAGAVKTPPEVTVPFAEPPTTLHVTAVFALPVTVAEKVFWAPSATVVVVGLTATVTAGGCVRVTVASL